MSAIFLFYFSEMAAREERRNLKWLVYHLFHPLTRLFPFCHHPDDLRNAERDAHAFPGSSTGYLFPQLRFPLLGEHSACVVRSGQVLFHH